jgi:hypothetical protein
MVLHARNFGTFPSSSSPLTDGKYRAMPPPRKMLVIPITPSANA